MDALEGLKAMPDASVDLIVTDPPYPIDRDNGTGRLFSGLSDKRNPIKTFNREREWFVNGYSKWEPFIDECLKHMKRILKTGGHLYFFVNETNLWPMKPIIDKHFNFKSLLVWHKGHTDTQPYGMGYHYRKSCEYVFLYVKGKSSKFIVDHGTYLHYPNNMQKVDHPTPKPVAMCRLFIEKSSETNGVVLDPFMGSGTVAIAAQQVGRQFIGFEIDKKYVEMTEKRLRQKILSLAEM